MSDKTWSLLKECIQVILVSLVLTFLLRSYIVEARIIPSDSMVPTLQVGDRLIVDKIIYLKDSLHRQDIVVFSPPSQAQAQLDETHKNDDLIKRIIGLPGDQIKIAGGKVYVNDKPLTELYLAEKPNYNFGPVVVPQGELFVLGDNRNYSLDSHYWGFLPINNVKGKAVVRFWPPGRLGIIND